MSTKKRILIINTIFILFLICFVIFLTIASRTFLTDIQQALYITYGLIVPIFFIIMGIVTRCISSRAISLINSLIFPVITICLMLLVFNLAYPKEDIQAINGMQETLSIFDDIGWDYIAYAILYILAGYIVTAVIFEFIRFFKNRKLCNEVAASSIKRQIRVDNPRILSAYNKKTNRREKYLIWPGKKHFKTSSRIIYYDKVELLIVDNDKNVYAMLQMPEKISMKEYLKLSKEL